MSDLGPRPFCWNCLADATEVQLTKEGQNWICPRCEQEIDFLITQGKDWAHLTDTMRGD